MEKTKPSIIVSSKYFKKFLRKASLLHENQVEITAILTKGVLTIYSLQYCVEHRGEGEFNLTIESVNAMIQVLKSFSDRPIVIAFERDGYFTIKNVQI